MGYNVQITFSNASIPAANLDEAYRRMCDLNTLHHDVKRGGSSDRHSADTGKPNANRWFSWMDWNYPETCPDARTILEELGFHTGWNESDRHLKILGYDSKTGQEELFIEAISDLFQPGSFIQWLGEDRCAWQWDFSPGAFA